MMEKKLKELIALVTKKEEKAKKTYEEALKLANEIAASAAASPSQSGDRFHSQSFADMSKEKYLNLKRLLNELNNKGLEACYLYEGEEIFLVDNPTMITGFKLISTQSLLGKRILEKKDDFKITL